MENSSSPTTKTIAKELKIQNFNNCLATEVFITIAISPPREKVPARSKVESSLFYATFGTEQIFIKCIDIAFCKFDRLTDTLTLWAYGKTHSEYKAWWLEQNPDTKQDTEMIICYYKRAT